MILYILIFLIILLLYFYNEKNGNPQSSLQLGIVITILALFVGLSDMLGGYDRYIYGELFDEIADIRKDDGSILFSSLFLTYYSEIGYCLWNVIISYITANRYIFIFITTLFVYFLIFQAIKSYTTNYIFALIIFMGLMFFFTFTYLRQIIAALLVWQSIKYILNRKLLKFIGIVMLAASFHNSAIIFFPLYFIPLKRLDNKYIIPLMALFFIIGVSGLPSNLFEIYGQTVNEIRGTEYAEDSSGTGFRFAYLFEAIFFITFIKILYDKIPNTNGANLMLNCALIFCAILLIFIKSENGGRLSWFFTLGIISTFTRFSSSFYFTQRNLIILTCTFLFFRILISWGEGGYQILYPYKTFLTNGVREVDKCHAKFEYDHLYDDNKFYR